MCAACGGKTKVIESRIAPGGCRRRRECLDCKLRVTTMEGPLSTEATIDTRGDTIRAMTDDELAEAISRNAVECLCDLVHPDGCPVPSTKDGGGQKGCKQAVLRWLQEKTL